jgi:hypothetical protein
MPYIAEFDNGHKRGGHRVRIWKVDGVGRWPQLGQSPVVEMTATSDKELARGLMHFFDEAEHAAYSAAFDAVTGGKP